MSSLISGVHFASAGSIADADALASPADQLRIRKLR
jgi:hypothetical protein